MKYFRRLLRTSERQKQSFESEFVKEEKQTRASFEASLLIAKSKKNYNIGDQLILPAAIKMSAIANGKKEDNKIRKIPLSNNMLLCQGGFPKSATINGSNSLHESKKAVNLLLSLMSRQTLPIRRIFCHMLGTFTITTFTSIYFFVNPYMDVLPGWIFFKKLMIFYGGGVIMDGLCRGL